MTHPQRNSSLHLKLKSHLFIFVWSVCYLNGFSQACFNPSKFDTLEIRGDSSLVVLKAFENSILKEEVMAFLIPDSILNCKYQRFFKNRYCKWLPATKMVRHGKSTQYLGKIFKKNEKGDIIKDLGEVQCISIYHLDKLVNQYYLNSKKENISLEDIEDKYLRGPCSNMMGTYLIDGNKKK